MLSILYQDTDVVAINKPHGLLVHRSRIAKDAQEFALQLLRDQLGQTVYPAHRIDRKTGGVLL
ncbi:MAG: pseudouridine synthase, partial [Bacteroidota bacterium]